MRSLGSANGIVNVGGFLASFVMMFAIGLVLDGVRRARPERNGESGSLYSLGRIPARVPRAVRRRRNRGRVPDHCAAADPATDARTRGNRSGPAVGCTQQGVEPQAVR